MRERFIQRGKAWILFRPAHIGVVHLSRGVYETEVYRTCDGECVFRRQFGSAESAKDECRRVASFRGLVAAIGDGLPP